MTQAARTRRITAAFGSRLREDSGQMVSEVLISTILFMAIFAAMFQLSLGLYDYNFVADASRQASRYAMVRGSTSCTNTPSLNNCDATSAEIKTWVQGLGYPGITGSSLSVTTSWLKASTSTPTTWSSCTSGTCNAPGNLVKVAVSYPVAIQVPILRKVSFSVSSTSEMVISQ